MDLESYKIFRVVAEADNLKEAARKLNLAPSALSNKMDNLEERFGAKLIIRKRGIRKLMLTEAGKILYDRSGYICEIDEAIATEIKALDAGAKGVVSISISPSMSLNFIEEYLSGFAKLFPNLSYDLNEVTVTKLENDLMYGLTEIGVACVPLSKPEAFNIVYQDVDALGAIFLDNGNLLERKEGSILELVSLDNIPLVISRGCLPTFKKACNDFNINAKILSVNTTKLAAVAWAKQGLGVAIVPVGCKEVFDSQLCCKIIETPKLEMKRTVVTAKGHALSFGTRAFLNYCCNLNDEWSVY